jgi:hypothetical protein
LKHYIYLFTIKRLYAEIQKAQSLFSLDTQKRSSFAKGTLRCPLAGIASTLPEHIKVEMREE